MALPTVTAYNQTASPVLLTRLGLTVPASSSLILTDFAWRHEILTDESLYAAIGADEILLALGADVLTKGESLKFFGIVSQEVRAQVRLLSVADETLSGAGGTIDGQTTVAGDRVLLTAQTDPTENGIWVVQAGAWVRPDDFAVGTSSAGALVTVGPDGTTYANQMWQSSADLGSDIVGTSNLAFMQSSGGATSLQSAYVAGNTITTSAGEGDITFTGTEDFLVTLANVDFDVTGALTFDATGVITIGGDADTGAINIGTSTSARILTIGNGTGATAVNIDTGTGGFDVDSLGVVSIGGTDTTNLTMTANSGVNKTLTISATNAGAGAGLIDVTADGSVSLSSTTSIIDIQASGNVTLDSSGGTIGIGTDADTGAINIGTAASARTITIGNSTTGTDVLITAATTGGEITLTAPLTRVTGDLVVEGTTTSVESQTVLLADNHIFINAGYSTVAAQTGGLVVNYLPIATTDTVAAGGFTAGVPATSNPTVATTGAATFTVGQFIQITNANNVENDGLYEVLSHAANVLTIRGVGLTAAVEDFTQNQFTTDATAGGSITRLNISVIRSGSDGVWEFGFGAVTPITFYDVINTNTLTLQNAYTGGNTINVTAGEGPLAITLTSDDFTVNGGNDVDFGGSTAVTTFNVDATGAITVDGAGVSIDGTAASNFSVTGANLTISTITSGNLSLTSAGTWTATGTTMDVDATGVLSLNSSGGAINVGNDADAFAINIGTGAAARTVTVGNGTGATAVLVQTGTEGFQINSLGTGIITDYGKSATDPTARGGGFQHGDRYFNTALDMEMRYDSSRSKWLSIHADFFHFGRNGNTGAGQYFRGPVDNLVMSATIGHRAPHNGTIVGIGYTRSDTAAATFDIVEGGVSRATLASAATSGGSNTLNGNFSAGGILSGLNQAGGNTMSNVIAWVKFRYRV